MLKGSKEQMNNGKMTCRYYDCGWCYAPEDVKNNSIQGGCFEPEYCATYLMQNKPKMTEIDISKVLIEGDTATIMGVEYKKVENKMSKFIKNPDEIILEDVKMIHYETMEEGRAVWLGIYLNNGKMYHLNIGGDNLYVNYSDETLD
jgi:hypothetical protein